jgi:lysophospholipase L1-like esterase
MLGLLRMRQTRIPLPHPIAALLVALACLLMLPHRAHAELSLRKFHERAEAREPLSIVFLGGSLTWGANASDPQVTSYRGRMSNWLREKYPNTPLAIHDAAIGGTGSQLGMFRLERDVLAHRPDLVFLDFTVNDDAEGTDTDKLASYEAILRTLLERQVMVVPVLTMFRGHAKPRTTLPARHQAHLALAEAYALPAANIIPYVRAKVEAGADPKVLWPFDSAHPDDAGYALFFEAVRERYESAIAAEGLVAKVPAIPLHGDLYAARTRRVLVDGPLPEGWTREKTWRTSLWFDGLASRWMGDVATATATAKSGPLEVEFTGSLVGIFGEKDGLTPPMRVFIDGQLVPPPAKQYGEGELWTLNTTKFAPPRKGSGALFNWTVLARGLAEGKHTLRLEPVWEGADPDAQIRVESVCSAGKTAP